MTTVVVTPAILRAPRITLDLYGTPYQWWMCPLREDADGTLYTQFLEPPGATDAAAVTAYRWQFGEPEPTLTDPLAMHLNVEYSLHDYLDVPRTLLTGMRATLELVWLERPGPEWRPIRRNSCVVGDYQTTTSTIESPRSWRDRWSGPLGLTGTECLVGSCGLEGYEPPSMQATALLMPESELIDEIDRLVNDQVRPGPRDDYHIDRYPKCARCGHDWHGLCCEQCACLGELEDPA